MRWMLLFVLLAVPCSAQVAPTLPTAPTAVNLPVARSVVLPAAGDPGTAYKLTLDTSGYTVVTVCPSSCTFTSLQTAINAATCSSAGEIIKLVFNSSVSGGFTLPNLSCAAGKYVIITTDTPANGPPAGTRITLANTGNVPKIICNTQNVPCFTINNSAQNWVLQDLELDLCSTCALADFTGALLQISNGGNATTVAQVPTNIIIDRVLMHGVATQGLRRSVELDCTNCALINSYMDENHEIGSDTQAVFFACTPGVILMDNNYLSGAGENIITGGSGCVLPTPVLPNDVMFNHNYVQKPQSWRVYYNTNTGLAYATTSAAFSAGVVTTTLTGIGGNTSFIRSGDSAIFAGCTNALFNGTYTVNSSPAPTATVFAVNNAAPSGTDNTCTVYFRDPTSTLTPATAWTVKNIYEMKLGRRYQAYGNVFDGSWENGQSGRAIVINTSPSDSNTPWAAESDIDMGWNLLVNSFGGFAEPACDTGSALAQVGNLGRNYFHDWLAYTLGGEASYFILVDQEPGVGDTGCTMDSIYFNHNTLITDGWAQKPSATVETITTIASGTVLPNFAFHNNIIGYDSTNGFFQSCQINSVPQPNCYPANAMYKNIVYDTVSGNCSQSFSTNAIQCPVAAISNVGFTNTGTRNYLLTDASIGHGTATDGLDVGISNYATFLTETAGTVAGVWSASSNTPGVSSGRLP